MSWNDWYAVAKLLRSTPNPTTNTQCPCTSLAAGVQTGVEKLAALRVFLLSNNKIAAWSEVERLGGLTALEELLLVGNPLYNEFKDKGDTQNYRIEVCLSFFGTA